MARLHLNVNTMNMRYDFDFSSADFLFDEADPLFVKVQAFLNEQMEELYQNGSLIPRPKNSPSRTYLHSRRVAEDAYYMCRVLGLNENVQKNMRMATMLHDLGKLDIPLNILDKPGRLSDEEFLEMKRHTDHGAARLARLKMPDHPFVKLATDIALHHHEQYTGRGYHGLKGSEIQHPVRLVTICDVFDAITGDRPYRRGSAQPSKHDVLCLMIDRAEGMGRHFGPWMLRVFIEYKYTQIGFSGNDHQNKKIESYLEEDPSSAASEMLGSDAAEDVACLSSTQSRTQTS